MVLIVKSYVYGKSIKTEIQLIAYNTIYNAILAVEKENIDYYLMP